MSKGSFGITYKLDKIDISYLKRGSEFEVQETAKKLLGEEIADDATIKVLKKMGVVFD